MSDRPTTNARGQNPRANLQNPRQPSHPNARGTKPKKQGSQRNLGAMGATSPSKDGNAGGDRSMEQAGDVPETPTPAARQRDPLLAETSDTSHDIPDDIFTPPGFDEPEQPDKTTPKRVSEDEVSQREVIKHLTFKKNEVKEDDDPPMSATQAMRQVALAAARAQYNDVKELYDKHLAHVTAVEAKSRNGAIDKAMMLSRAYLVELHAEMKSNEAALIETLKGSNPEVVFVPNHVEPPVISRQGSSSGHNVNIHSKRKSHPETGNSPSITKKSRPEDVTKYLDIEAKESNKESRAEVLGKVRSSRGRIKSRATVTTSDDEEAEAFANSGEKVHIKDAVDAKKRQAKEKVEKADDGENMEVDSTCIFHVEKPDLSQLITDTDAHEIIEIKEARDSITSSQFNWGEVLAIAASNSIACWRFDSEELRRRPGSSALGPHLNYVRALLADKDMMQLRLQTSPRLIQVSSTDPLVTRDRLDWALIQTSAQYPWLKKNAVFKALHSMCCRTDLKRAWSTHSVLKVNIRNAHVALHDLLADSYRIVTFDRDHGSHVVRTEGEDGIDQSMVSLGGHITWLVNQVDSVDEGEVVQAKRSRAIPSSVKALQKKYLNVFLGLNLIYESEVHNGIINKAASKGSTKKTLAMMKSNQKASSVLQQLYNDRNQYSSSGLKRLPGGSRTSGLIGASSQSVPAREEPAATEKGSVDKVSAETSRDISNTKKQCLHSLSLFLMFGTAGLFHVIPNWKEASMPETATLLHLSSLLSDRRFEQTKDEPHACDARAWNRLDDLMYRSLAKFIGEDGRFKPQSRVNWESMTEYFREEFAVKKLAPLFMLDLLSETHRPGLSLGLEGRVMDHVEVESAKLYQLNSPAMESFRALWGQTEGPAYPVTDRGASLYPGVTGRQQRGESVSHGEAGSLESGEESHSSGDEDLGENDEAMEE
ncbi:hypothetical protein DFH28DRAFT_1130653 [Melampsora americana]|nr:hypothetical protein DFH28DRAFT_1130653 [Melampsora americana]